ncbi:MAG: glycosyltransferase family 4 protein [Acinetobacter sp.]|uniref:glycosyltransferase family 4 protein n=1 Tax=Acinetobacter sp. TaxID=472 RepID=UPI0026E0603C|nr:glycosyltransferase family 4 protein [Acinetobacter sp.]MDO5542828.1 glycosyltransferase family 4 protein [Acinetobacter sp.]
MKKILFYIPSFANGGAERVASVLLNYWSALDKYEITVINTLPKENDFFKVNSAIPRSFLKFNYNLTGVKFFLEKFYRIYLLRSFLKSRSEVIIVSFMSSPSILLLISSIGLNKKIVCCEHTNYFLYGNKLTRLIRNILYYFFAKKITLLTDRDIKSYPRFLHSKITVLPNPLGVDGSKYNFRHGKIKNNNMINLLFVGRLVAVKGIDRLCSILNELKDIHNWKLTICGDGVLRSDLEEFVKINKLSNRVFLKGSVKDIEDYYLNADLLVMTSISEGLPMVIAEAMSFGVPVIAFDCPTGPREFISHNINGLLVKDGDINEYIKELKFVINNPEKLAILSERASSSVDSYSLSNIDKIWDCIFVGLNN